LQTVASEGKGIAELYETLQEFQRYQKEKHILDRKFKQRIESRIRRYLNEQILNTYWDAEKEEKFTSGVQEILTRQKTLQQLLKDFVK
ncbi:MAG: hypothetical protein GXO76_05390, partial [Calditrichaeota bacterium]|nr:hypothetical protein [Calditrichota bacterium]